jgi:hypothetical protein
MNCDILIKCNILHRFILHFFLRVIYSRHDFQVAVFWVVTRCSVAVAYQRFGRPCCLHFQVVTPCSDVGYQVSEVLAASIFRVKMEAEIF